MMSTHHFFATCARGTERALAEELREMGLAKVSGSGGGVRFTGTLEAGMRACLWSRIATRVLSRLGGGPAKGADALYESARAVAWEAHVDPRRTFAVRATLKSSELTHTGFAALKVKDAIADRLRAKKGSRPSVDTRRPDLAVSVHVDSDEATFYLDMAGEPLHRRGWRSGRSRAPLKENLAAAILRIGRYDPGLPLLDPMCGSATIVIEAAHLARRLAPGLKRGFAFERWPAFTASQRAVWRDLREQAKEAQLPSAPAMIIGRDHSDEIVEGALRNLRRAGVSGDVTIEKGDARSPGELPEGCQVFSNPPYGERLGRRRLQLEGLFRRLGEVYLSSPRPSKVVFLCGSPALEPCLGARPSARHVLFNGPIRCALLEYGPHIG